MKKTGPGADGKRVTDDTTVQKFNNTSTSISGTAEGLRSSLKELEAEIKQDEEGKKEYATYLKKLEVKRADLQRTVDERAAWLEAFAIQQESNGFEKQYKSLLEQIEQIYGGAKEFHGKGIELLIKEMGYHIAYKRWNDTFSAIPFKPQ